MNGQCFSWSAVDSADGDMWQGVICVHVVQMRQKSAEAYAEFRALAVSDEKPLHND